MRSRVSKRRKKLKSHDGFVKAGLAGIPIGCPILRIGAVHKGLRIFLGEGVSQITIHYDMRGLGVIGNLMSKIAKLAVLFCW